MEPERLTLSKSSMNPECLDPWIQIILASWIKKCSSKDPDHLISLDPYA